MAIPKSARNFEIRTAGLAVGFLGMLLGACKSDGLGRVDGAVDATPGGASTTGTGSLSGTATVANTGGAATTSTGTVSSTGTMTASASPTSTGQGTAIGPSTTATVPAATATATSTASAPARTAPATSTGTSTGTGATWRQIKVSRTNGLSFCPVDGTAASVVVKRGDDGSLILSGEAFRAAPGETTGCLSSYDSVCTKKQGFPDMALTPAQRDQLERLLAAMPPGKCTSKGYVDPCILTTLSIDGVSDTDWGSWGCVEDGGPGTHLAGERAIVAFIDSLVPGNVPAGVDASAGDAVTDSTLIPAERATGPCDVYADAKLPCVAAYSMIRALSKSYNGPLFQVRAGSSSHNNTLSGGTTKDIMPGPAGFVDASAVDEACGMGYCTVSVLYDHSGNGNDLKRAPKGNTAGGAAGALDDYESIATKGLVMVGGHQVYSLYMNKLEGYRTQVGVVGTSMPTGSQPQGLYMLADGTRKATACCWEFGNVTTKPATEFAFVDALDLATSYGGKGAGDGPWFLFDFGGGLWAGGSKDGDPGTPNEIVDNWGEDPFNPPRSKGNLKNPSLDRSKFSLGFLKVRSSEYTLRAADLSTATEVATAWKGGVPATVSHKGGIVLGVGADNSNNSWGTFYEGAIVAGYPSDDIELSVMKNIKAVGYATVP